DHREEGPRAADDRIDDAIGAAAVGHGLRDPVGGVADYGAGEDRPQVRPGPGHDEERERRCDRGMGRSDRGARKAGVVTSHLQRGSGAFEREEPFRHGGPPRNPSRRPALGGTPKGARMDFLIAARLEFAPEVTATALPIVVLRLLAAAVLGGIVGFERELHARNAGLRTHMLISVAACLFALVGLELMAIAEAAGDEAKADPLRLIEAVTAGVAFLVAGSIISSGGRVQGLTTGAGMWLSGATGLACGTGHLAL